MPHFKQRYRLFKANSSQTLLVGSSESSSVQAITIDYRVLGIYRLLGDKIRSWQSSNLGRRLLMKQSYTAR
jgi:hypothetical protein